MAEINTENAVHGDLIVFRSNDVAQVLRRGQMAKVVWTLVEDRCYVGVSTDRDEHIEIGVALRAHYIEDLPKRPPQRERRGSRVQKYRVAMACYERLVLEGSGGDRIKVEDGRILFACRPSTRSFRLASWQKEGQQVVELLNTWWTTVNQAE